MQKLLLCLLCTFTLSFSLKAQVLINEYSASNLKDYIDDYGKYEDWIELYNVSNEAVNLNGWFLSDKSAKPTKWGFTSDLFIEPNSYVVVWCSGRDTIDATGIHTNFKLTQTKGNEVLTLSTPDETTVQSLPMELTKLGHSRALNVDGGTEWKVCTSPTLALSNNDSEQYDAYTDQVLISLDAGFYSGPQSASITTFQNDVNVYYTIDGTEPTEESTLYTAGEVIEFDKTTVLKAKAFSTNPAVLPGKITYNTYFIDEEFTVPVFSVAADQIQDLANGQGELRPQGTLEYFENGKREAKSYGELNRHGQDSWILPHRSLDWISRDEMGYNRTVNAKLFNYSDRDDYQRFMFRASGDDNYPANGDFFHEGSCHVRDEYVHTLAQKGNMKLDVRAVERVVLFLNGEYWGLYGLRERPADHDYTNEYYDQDKYNLHYLATWGSTWAEYGGDDAFDAWFEFRDFVMNNDMSSEDNYQQVKDQFQVKSLCDYMIINLNTVASDWLNYNTGWWRGLNPEGGHKKWGYILWDNDATFDYYINYSGVPNTDPDAQPCDIEEISDFMDGFFNGNNVGAHEKIFLKLLDENDEFRQLYYSRQADFMNTIFSCENMTTTFDSLIGIIEPEMPRQIERWGGTMEGWQANVQEMREFIEARCTAIGEGMVDCYNIDGPHQVTLMVEPEGAGEIQFNSLDIEQFPWTGDYFGMMPNLIEAKANDEQLPFLFWKTENGSLINPDSTLVEAELYLAGNDTLTAVFGTVSGVTEELFSTEWTVYPTTTRDDFSILVNFEKSNLVDIQLLNMAGDLVQSFSFGGNVQAGKYHWNASLDPGLPNGMYIIRMQTKEGVLSKRLIKQ